MLALHAPALQQKQTRRYDQYQHDLGLPLIALLHDPLIKEIMLNPDGRVWCEHLQTGMQATEITFEPLAAYKLISTIADLQNKVIHSQQPILETNLPHFGFRFSAAVPDIVSAPIFTIRKSVHRTMTMQDYLDSEVINKAQYHALIRAIQQRQAILIAGGPGTGKTTLANALLKEMMHQHGANERVVIIEDTPELVSPLPNSVNLLTSSFADYNDLLKATLRLRPDKICLGECRGAETLVLLKAWNTGTNGGLATIHANSASHALTRLSELLASETTTDIPQLICSAISHIVSISVDSLHGRRVNELIVLDGFKNGKFQFRQLG